MAFAEANNNEHHGTINADVESFSTENGVDMEILYVMSVRD